MIPPCLADLLGVVGYGLARPDGGVCCVQCCYPPDQQPPGVVLMFYAAWGLARQLVLLLLSRVRKQTPFNADRNTRQRQLYAIFPRPKTNAVNSANSLYIRCSSAHTYCTVGLEPFYSCIEMFLYNILINKSFKILSTLNSNFYFGLTLYSS